MILVNKKYYYYVKKSIYKFLKLTQYKLPQNIIIYKVLAKKPSALKDNKEWRNI